MQDFEDRLRNIESRQDEQEQIVSDLWRKIRRNAFDIDRVTVAGATFLGLILVLAFGLRIQTDWLSFDLSGEILVQILQVSGVGAAMGAIAKYVLDKAKNED
jgi:hypothetical protein